MKVLLPVVVGVVWWVGLVTCTACSVPNDCVPVSGKPFCVNSVCSECQGNCDCPIGKYCRKQQGLTDSGTCVSIDTSIFGTPCNPFTLWVDPTSTVPIEVPTVDTAETVCGVPVFNPENLTQFLFYEWLGYCTMGACAQCENAGLTINTFMATISNPSALMCPGTQCKAGEIVASILAQKYTWATTIPQGISFGTLLFVMVLTVLCAFMCLALWKPCLCRGSKKAASDRHVQLPEKEHLEDVEEVKESQD
ncbi:hypothetical protein Pelo_3550 [Pelomyxa schiedti]|nr:hypothetical protein Pelo_3550 [Pelomyxa schiedti]